MEVEVGRQHGFHLRGQHRWKGEHRLTDAVPFSFGLAASEAAAEGGRVGTVEDDFLVSQRAVDGAGYCGERKK